MKQYQLIAKALHKAKPKPTNIPTWTDYTEALGVWNDCVESIASELSDSAYRPEFLLIADTGKVNE